MVCPPAITQSFDASRATVGPVELCSERTYCTPTLPRRRIVSVMSRSMFALA